VKLPNELKKNIEKKYWKKIL